jgi:hypothetical protein
MPPALFDAIAEALETSLHSLRHFTLEALLRSNYPMMNNSRLFQTLQHRDLESMELRSPNFYSDELVALSNPNGRI